MSPDRAGATVAAIVLAAGSASRLGVPKQLVRIGGESLLRRICRSALDAGAAPLVVVLGSHAERMRSEIADLPARAVRNEDWNLGIGSSIRRGIAEVIPASDAIMILLADQPLLAAAHLRRLIDAWRSGMAEVVASYYGRAPGVPAIFSGSRIPCLAGLPDQTGAKKLIQESGSVAMTVPLAEAAFDLDTTDDFEKLVAMGLNPVLPEVFERFFPVE